ncbi:MAG: PilT/PilU family type 4a pilus ATPase [Chloroflexi bacterium]|nr:PilT/PilU family type 4a pilus ATPase [Chloroflexota bacterium]
MDVFTLLYLAKMKNASDLHIIAGNPPFLRVYGLLQPLEDMSALTEDDIEGFFNQLTSERERAEFTRNLELDFGRTVPGVGRVRCNAARQQATLSLVFRLLPPTIPSLEELGLPAVCRELVLRPRGLAVITGPTGSGKSTTLSAMIEYLNANVSRRVVTIEDPIEYVHTSRRCTITQRELGGDTLSFASALKHVLRQDPDVILVGEMRDPDTAAAVLTIAETGHLVLTTGHAPSASQAIERIVDLFPLNERHLVQTRLASLLLGVLCQTLVPRADGIGRIPAVEIMLATPPVRNLIREGKIYQLPNVIRTQAREGMQLLDQALASLYFKRLINRQNLFAFCNDQNEIAQLTEVNIEPSIATKNS